MGRLLEILAFINASKDTKCLYFHDHNEILGVTLACWFSQKWSGKEMMILEGKLRPLIAALLLKILKNSL